MENENKKLRLRIILISAFILIAFVSFMFVMVKMIKENGKCVDDPFRYAAQKLKDSGGNYACYCNSLDPQLLDFSFSAEEGITIIENENYFNLDNILKDMPLGNERG